MKIARSPHALVRLTLLAVACATSKGADVKAPTSSFLGPDARLLTPGDVSKGQAGLRYFNPAAQWQQYKSVLIEPVTFWGDETSKVAPSDQQALATYFKGALDKEFGEKFQVVSEPGPGVVRVQFAITDAEAATPVCARSRWSCRSSARSTPSSRWQDGVCGRPPGRGEVHGRQDGAASRGRGGPGRRHQQLEGRRAGRVGRRSVRDGSLLQARGDESLCVDIGHRDAGSTAGGVTRRRPSPSGDRAGSEDREGGVMVDDGHRHHARVLGDGGAPAPSHLAAL